MLFFTYDSDLHKHREDLRAELERETGQKCIILDCGCTGVYYIPSGKEGSDERSQGNGGGDRINDKQIPVLSAAGDMIGQKV